MRHGIVLFTCDRGITPAGAAKAAEERGHGWLTTPGERDIGGRAAALHRAWAEAYLDRSAGRVAAWR